MNLSTIKLVNTPHGRHLLLVTLLEHTEDDIWQQKCRGKLKIFLPESLKSPRQPPPPLDACLLEDIMDRGRIVGRQEIMDKLRVIIQMDHFYMNLNPGENLVTRTEFDAPHMSKSRWSLGHLQDNLMAGQVNREEFSWGGCGRPRHLNIPRGTESGMDWYLVVVVTKVLPEDLSRLSAWEANSQLAWSYCGVTTGQVPDSRPLGFPFDIETEMSVLTEGYRMANWAVVPVKIVHQDTRLQEDLAVIQHTDSDSDKTTT